MKPFKKLETKNLGLVFSISRLFLILGAFGTALILAVLIFTMSFMNTIAMGAVYMQFLPYCFVLIVTACLLAVLIAIEESYRKRTLTPELES
jgi:hypothetical protein